MADVSTPDAPVPVAFPPGSTAFMADRELLAQVNPFGDRECVSVDVAKEVGLPQLADEIEAETGVQVQLTLSRSRTGGAPTPTHPSRLHVCPPVEEDVLRRVIAAHEADPDYGLTPEQRERAELLEKLRQGKSLSGKELNLALRFALGAG